MSPSPFTIGPMALHLLLTVVLLVSFRLLVVKIREKEFQSDEWAIIPFDDFGFTHNSMVEMNITGISLSDVSMEADLVRLGFFLSTHNAWIHACSKSKMETLGHLCPRLLRPVLNWPPILSAEGGEAWNRNRSFGYLKTLNLNSNGLTGTLPDSIGEIVFLKNATPPPSPSSPPSTTSSTPRCRPLWHLRPPILPPPLSLGDRLQRAWPLRAEHVAVSSQRELQWGWGPSWLILRICGGDGHGPPPPLLPTLLYVHKWLATDAPPF